MCCALSGILRRQANSRTQFRTQPHGISARELCEAAPTADPAITIMICLSPMRVQSAIHDASLSGRRYTVWEWILQVELACQVELTTSALDRSRARIDGCRSSFVRSLDHA